MGGEELGGYGLYGGGVKKGGVDAKVMSLQIMRSSGLVGARLLFDSVNNRVGLSYWVTKCYQSI